MLMLPVRGLGSRGLEHRGQIQDLELRIQRVKCLGCRALGFRTFVLGVHRASSMGSKSECLRISQSRFC